MKKIFCEPHTLSTVEQEVIARQIVRNLEKLPFIKIKQLEEDTWSKFCIELQDTKYKKIFTRFKDKRFKLINNSKGFVVYVSTDVTPIDARSFVGEVFYNYKTIDKSFIDNLRQQLALALLKLAKTIYPVSKRDNNGR